MTDNTQIEAVNQGEAERLKRIATMALERRAMLITQKGQPVELDSEYFPVADGSPLVGLELLDWLRRAHQDVHLRMVGIGIAYLLLKAQVGPNQFSAALAEIGADRSDAYKYIRVATMYAELSDEVVGLAPQLPGRKSQIALSRLPTAIVEKLAKEGAFEELAALPEKDRLRELGALRRIHKQEEERVERIAQLQREREALTRPLDLGHMPPIVHQIRSEAPAFATGAMDHIERLIQMNNALLDSATIRGKPDTILAAQKAALGPLYVAAKAVLASAQQLVTRLEDWGDRLPEQDAPVSLMPAEAIAAQERLRLMMLTSATARRAETGETAPATRASKKTGSKKVAKKTAKKATRRNSA